MFEGVRFEKQHVRIGYDVLRLKRKGHEISKARPALEATASPPQIKIEAAKTAQLIKAALDVVCRRILVRNGIWNRQVLPFEDVHVPGRSLVLGLAPCEKLLALVGIHEKAKPATGVANGLDGDRAAVRSKAVIDNRYYGRLPRPRCATDDVHPSLFERDNSGLERGPRGPQNDLENLESH